MKDTGYHDTLVYFLVLVLINTILSVPLMVLSLSSLWAVFGGISGRLGFGTLTGFGIVILAFLMIIAAFVFLFIGAAWFHLWLYPVGGRNGYRDTQSTCIRGNSCPAPGGDTPWLGSLQLSGLLFFLSWVSVNFTASQPAVRWEPFSLP